jgi:hypothetical protein
VLLLVLGTASTAMTDVAAGHLLLFRCLRGCRSRGSRSRVPPLVPQLPFSLQLQDSFQDDVLVQDSVAAPLLVGRQLLHQLCCLGAQLRVAAWVGSCGLFEVMHEAFEQGGHLDLEEIKVDDSMQPRRHAWLSRLQRMLSAMAASQRCTNMCTSFE